MQNLSSYISKPVAWAFGLCFLYWGYLFFTTQMLIACDAAGYEQLGNLIYKKGWLEFFKTGPSREPIYPALVAASMAVGDWGGISYHKVQVIIQLGILVTTQLLMCWILGQQRINRTLIAIVVLYFGFSPAIVNSALSLYSEIAAYPVVLVLLLIAARCWRAVQSALSQKEIVLWAIGLALGLLALTLIKGVTEIIAPFFLAPFLYLVFKYLRQPSKKIAVNALIVFVVSLFCYVGGISGYKYVNKVYNGNFAVTDRGPWLFYGNAVVRTQPLTLPQMGAALAFVPGEGFCRSFFSEEQCSFWSFHQLDPTGYIQLRQLINSGMTVTQANVKIVQQGFDVIQQRPWQYLFLMGIEGFKLFFWESTQIGFVQYPRWLNTIYHCFIFKNLLRLAVSFVTLVSFFYIITYVWRNKDSNAVLLFFMMWFVGMMMFAYSLGCVLNRYALPLVPVFMIIIANALKIKFGIFERNKKELCPGQ